MLLLKSNIMKIVYVLYILDSLHDLMIFKLSIMTLMVILERYSE